MYTSGIMAPMGQAIFLITLWSMQEKRQISEQVYYYFLLVEVDYSYKF